MLTATKVPRVYPPKGKQTLKQLLADLGLTPGYEKTEEGMNAFNRVSLFSLDPSMNRMRGLLMFLLENDFVCDSGKHIFIPYKSGDLPCIAKVFFTKDKSDVKIETKWNALDPVAYSIEDSYFLTGFTPDEN